ncbi:MAG: hydrolase [Alphaproteobacteria bacterium]|nr:MAG: hydrolase [Alphaproteobacteria bacterium]
MQHHEALSFIETQEEHMKHLVWQWSSINSGSYHRAGLDRMRAALADNFLWLHGDMEEVPLQPMTHINARGEVQMIELAPALRIRKRSDAPIKIFLCGHYDTVFGEEHPFQAPRLVDSNTINGPGVADLKGGLVVMLKALETLERSPLASQIGWEILLNPDEEIGSIGSDPLLKEAAQRNHIGLIYEPSLPDGTIVSGRKGTGNFSIVMHGKAAHAGREHHLGRNAIVKLAELTIACDALNGARPDVTINAGVIEGGVALNVVPDVAVMRFNVRIGTVEDQHWVEQQITRILEEFNQRHAPDYRAEIHGRFTRPPKIITHKDRALWDGLESSGAMLGLTIKSQPSGGCCDGNNLAAYGLSNIDTLGVRGGHIHSDQEYVLLDSLVERAKLSALLLLRIANGEIVLSSS